MRTRMGFADARLLSLLCCRSKKKKTKVEKAEKVEKVEKNEA